MIQHDSPVKIFEISGTKIGGRLGELPTVLIGSLFYSRQAEVKDHRHGEFDKTRTADIVREAKSLSETTGNPLALDLMAYHPEAMKKYLRFIVDLVDCPILVDGADSQTRLACLEEAETQGVRSRLIYDAVSPDTSEEELKALKDHSIESAIVMAYDKRDFTPQGRIRALIGEGERPGLVALAQKAGVTKLLIDTVVLDVPGIILAGEAIHLVHEKFGYPAGCSPANATYEWKRSKMDSALKRGFESCDASANVALQLMGANFLIFGPLKAARYVYPACAIADAMIAYQARKHGIKPLTKSHPIYKVF